MNILTTDGYAVARGEVCPAVGSVQVRTRGAIPGSGGGGGAGRGQCRFSFDDAGKVTNDNGGSGQSKIAITRGAPPVVRRPPLSRKYELGNPATNTKIGASRINFVRIRSGNRKFRALRLDSEGTARKARIIDVVYNASTNELVRTKTLVKNAIIVIDASLFHQWYESHYLLHQGKKVGEEDILAKKRSKRVMK